MYGEGMPPHELRDPIPEPPPALIGLNFSYNVNGEKNDNGVDHLLKLLILRQKRNDLTDVFCDPWDDRGGGRCMNVGEKVVKSIVD